MYDEIMNKKEIVLNKHSAIIQMSNRITAVQRKGYNALLFFAKKELSEKNPINYKFEVEINIVLKVIGLGKENYKYLKKHLRGLQDLKVEYNVLNKDKKEKWGSFSLLAGVEIENGVIVYSFPHQILDTLIDPKIYAFIDLTVIKGLKSKYAIALYELLQDYKKVQMPKMTIEKFRKLMGVKEKQYTMFSIFRERIIEKAISEINQSEKINFVVDYELEKKGRKYFYIKFHIKPKPKASLSFQTSPQVRQIQSVSGNSNSVSALIDLIPAEHITAAVKKMIIKSAKENGMEYVQRNIQYTINSNPKNFAAYLAKALKENYGEKSESKLIFEAKAKEEKVKDIAEENEKKEKYEKYKKQYEELSDEKIESLIYKVAVHSHLIRKQIKNGITAELKANSIVKARVIAEMIKNGNAKSGSEKNKKVDDDQEIRNQKKLDEALGKI